MKNFETKIDHVYIFAPRKCNLDVFQKRIHFKNGQSIALIFRLHMLAKTSQLRPGVRKREKNPKGNPIHSENMQDVRNERDEGEREKQCLLNKVY